MAAYIQDNALEILRRIIDYILRTAAMKAGRDQSIVDGIKGESVLASIASGAPIDYMHCVLEGVVKRCLEQWAC